jgi:hypothetical protein
MAEVEDLRLASLVDEVARLDVAVVHRILGACTRESSVFDAFAHLATNGWQLYVTTGTHSHLFCVFIGGPRGNPSWR